MTQQASIWWADSIAVAGTASYDPSTAEKLLRFSEASYCGDRWVAAWDCAPCKLEPAFNVSHIISLPRHDTHGFVGYDAVADAVVVAFRGTDPLQIESWLVDLRSVKLVD